MPKFSFSHINLVQNDSKNINIVFIKLFILQFHKIFSALLAAKLMSKTIIYRKRPDYKDTFLAFNFMVRAFAT